MDLAREMKTRLLTNRLPEGTRDMTWPRVVVVVAMEASDQRLTGAPRSSEAR